MKPSEFVWTPPPVNVKTLPVPQAEKKAYPIVMASDVYLPHHGMPKENES